MEEARTSAGGELSTPSQPSPGPVAAPLPARMLNEFAYCPRLFFLEYVQGDFRDNPDTVEGRITHRRVDKEKGKVPAADELAPEDKVRIPFSEERVARTLELRDQARKTASDGVVPPPLVDSPKCPRCSLVSICLPDETTALTSAEGEVDVRRLGPARGDAAPP